MLDLYGCIFLVHPFAMAAFALGREEQQTSQKELALKAVWEEKSLE